MTNHQDSNLNPIAKRFKFNNRDRKPEESKAEYIAELRQLAEHCEYGTILQDIPRYRLVCGLKHERIKQRLLSKVDTLTLEKGIDIG